MAWGERIAEMGGRRAPFLRWSMVRMLFGMKTLLRDWQVGDGREQAVLDHLRENVPAGDLDAAIAGIDDFAYSQKYLINVGDEKGAILDAALLRIRPLRVLEVGAYVGYSALRIARMLPDGGQLISVEYNADNARIATEVSEHAGVSNRVRFVVGTVGDEGGRTLSALRSAVGERGGFDLVFLDHDKDFYVSDLERLIEAGLLQPGGVVVADNVGFPGAPEYLSFMRDQEGKRFRTVEHETHVEYQSLLKDRVLESTLL